MTATGVDVTVPEVGPPPGIRFRRRLSYRQALAELWQSRELTRTLLERDLRIRYKQTVLGFGWSVVGPVTFMLVFTLFFAAPATSTPGVHRTRCSPTSHWCRGPFSPKRSRSAARAS